MNGSEGARVAAILQSAIRLSKLTYRDIERELGWSVGTVTRLMRGGLEFKLKHMLSILGVLQFSPGRLFAVAYPFERGNSPGEDRLQTLLEAMYAQPAQPARPAAEQPAVTQDKIDQMVLSALRNLLRAGIENAPDKQSDQLEK
jgi:transcriptional regulator with XRE-family HTH domain